MSNLSKPRQLAAEIIDLVEDKIRIGHPAIDEMVKKIEVDGEKVGEKVGTLLHGEPYYALEDLITEKIEGSR